MAKTRLDYSLTTEQLRSALDYDPTTGVFTWKRRPDRSVQWNGKWAGKAAGTPGPNFVQIMLGGRRYRANRLAWWYVYGEFPSDMIDHANGDWRDNRLSNLRIATRSENAANSGPPRTNTSGFKGVCWDKRAGKWLAQISHQRAHYWLGHFSTAQEAHNAYRAAALRFFGEFARLK